MKNGLIRSRMRNIQSYEYWNAINELRVLGMPYKIMSKGDGWQEIHREALKIGDDGDEKEIGHISFGISNTPSNNRWFVIINIETFPISGWGSHQIMTVHQSDHLDRESALKELEYHWKTLEFNSVDVQKGTFPTQSFTSTNKNEAVTETAYEEGKRKPTPEEIEMCKSPDGFNQVNHCKALGLIPREDGTKAVSKKYGGKK
jgi:hypothetical protein